MENEEKQNNTLISKLVFWFVLNCIIFTGVFLYQSYAVIFEGKILTYKTPKLYKDTDFLLEEFMQTYDMICKESKCYPQLKSN